MCEKHIKYQGYRTLRKVGQDWEIMTRDDILVAHVHFWSMSASRDSWALSHQSLETLMRFLRFVDFGVSHITGILWSDIDQGLVQIFHMWMVPLSWISRQIRPRDPTQPLWLNKLWFLKDFLDVSDHLFLTFSPSTSIIFWFGNIHNK